MSAGQWAHGEARVEIGPDRVATLFIDAPERRNALTPSLVDDLIAAVEYVDRQEGVGALVVASTGPAFCAGADLGQLDGANEAVLRQIYEAFLRIKDLALPTVAAIGGPAVGAGMNLALACDLRVVTPEAVLDSRFAAIGLHPGGGATWMLRQVSSQSVATAVLLFGQKIRGEEAVRRGIAWTCVPAEDLIGAARELAARAARIPRGLSGLIKRSLADTVGMDHAEALELELERQVWTTTQPWYAQARATTR